MSTPTAVPHKAMAPGHTQHGSPTCLPFPESLDLGAAAAAHSCVNPVMVVAARGSFVFWGGGWGVHRDLFLVQRYPTQTPDTHPTSGRLAVRGGQRSGGGTVSHVGVQHWAGSNSFGSGLTLHPAPLHPYTLHPKPPNPKPQLGQWPGVQSVDTFPWERGA